MNSQLVAEEMPLLWKELCEEFQKHCNAFNEQTRPQRKLGFYLIGVHHFIVRPDALEEIVIGHYHFDTYRISIEMRRAGIEWFVPSISQVATGEVKLASASTSKTMNPKLIARNAITAAITSNSLQW
jgi:hypothetical protein